MTDYPALFVGYRFLMITLRTCVIYERSKALLAIEFPVV